MTKKEREKARKMAEDARDLEDAFAKFSENYSFLNISEPLLRCMFSGAGAHAIRHLQNGNYSDVKCQSFTVFAMDAIKMLGNK